MSERCATSLRTICRVAAGAAAELERAAQKILYGRKAGRLLGRGGGTLLPPVGSTAEDGWRSRPESACRRGLRDVKTLINFYKKSWRSKSWLDYFAFWTWLFALTCWIVVRVFVVLVVLGWVSFFTTFTPLCHIDAQALLWHCFSYNIWYNSCRRGTFILHR